MSNQNSTRPSQMASKNERELPTELQAQLPTELQDYIEYWKQMSAEAAQPLCRYCHMPEIYCDCSNYDAEGNEL